MEAGLQRLEIFHHVAHFRFGQAEAEARVITSDHVQQRLKSAVVIKAASVLRFHEQTRKRFCTLARRLECLASLVWPLATRFATKFERPSGRWAAQSSS